MSEPAMSQATMKLKHAPDESEVLPLYSNFVQLNFTPSDFTFHFGMFTQPPHIEPPESGLVDVLVHPVAKVTIPLNMVRATMALLERQIQSWEQSFGPLPDQPEAARPVESGRKT